METLSLWEKLQAINAGFAQRFPTGNNPFQMMTRLLEECGELATEVNIFEDSGIKRQKHGEPDPKRLAQEVKGVLICALQIAQHYGAEAELAESIEYTYQRLQSEGWITYDASARDKSDFAASAGNT
jgi:NTP pyrophosphatase (non-canonical NTP hydrolase)